MPRGLRSPRGPSERSRSGGRYRSGRGITDKLRRDLDWGGLSMRTLGMADGADGQGPGLPDVPAPDPTVQPNARPGGILHHGRGVRPCHETTRWPIPASGRLFGETLRLAPPPAPPWKEDVPWYRRQASRLEVLAPTILRFDALAGDLPGNQRRRTFAAFRSAAHAAVRWDLVGGW